LSVKTITPQPSDEGAVNHQNGNHLDQNNTEDPSTDLLEKVIKIENELKDLKETQSKRLSYKWWALYVSAVFSFTVIWYGFFPLIDYLFSSLKESTELKDSLAKAGLVPENYSI